MPSIDEEFEGLIEEFLRKMASVECTEDEYASWLRAAIEEIEVAISATTGG